MNVDIFHQRLFQWWREFGRVLPWREKASPSSSKARGLTLRDAAFTSYFTNTTARDPYRVIVSEVMLQQTQVSRVLEKYQHWMQRWPTIHDLAQAKLSDVLIEWKGLGYNRRAKYVWELARVITGELNGVWPQTEAELIELPGIGKYTARALLVFAFNQEKGMVDTNIKRILQRWFWQDVTDREWFAFADQVLPKGQADPWGQALMDFGALVCTANHPSCASCPLNDICQANLWAQSQGYTFFSQYLDQERQLARPLKKPVSPFSETDRFFRGRIIDHLREGSMTKSQLRTTMKKAHGLVENARFTSLLAKLKQEGLIQITDQILALR